MYALREGTCVKPNYEYLSSNPRAIDFLTQNPEYISRYIWTNPCAEKLVAKREKIEWLFLVQNPADWALDILEANLDKFDIVGLANNPNPRAAKYFVNRELKKRDWFYLSQNTSTWAQDLLKANFENIEWCQLSSNPGAMDLILDNLDKISWTYLSCNPNPKAIQLLKENRDKIDWTELCSNENPEAIKMLREVGLAYWDLEYLSYNMSRASLDLLLEVGPEPDIEWQFLCRNPYIFKLKARAIFEGPVDIREWAWEYPKEYLKLQVIRKRLMRAYLDPVYKLCRSRLNREFSSM